MKATEIINLCEEDMITGQEFNEQFRAYFIKKMRSIGADWVDGDESSLLLSQFILGNKFNFNFGDDFRSAVKLIRKYGKAFCKIIKNSKFSQSSNGAWLFIHCDGEGLWKQNFAFWCIECYVASDQSSTVMVEISLGYDVREDIFKNFDFIISRKVLIDACAKIDEIAKAIRLVPFGGRNES